MLYLLINNALKIYSQLEIFNEEIIFFSREECRYDNIIIYNILLFLSMSQGGSSFFWVLIYSS